MDFEENPLIWLPPEREDEDDDTRKQELFPALSPSDHQGIAVSLSTRCTWRGTVCERSRLLTTKRQESTDLHLGKYLQDYVFDQNWRCSSCEMPVEAHMSCYTHQRGSITVSVKNFPDFILPGESEGKIWMWHKCLKCPHANGLPPATKRVLMSDAARNSSFGKFLELNFSNHADTNMVSGCGHSINRDCLQFYGSGRTVACFRYASVNVYSVVLPPQKLESIYDNQDWIQREANEVCRRADDFFAEVSKVLHGILEKITVNCGEEVQNSSQQIAELEEIFRKEKMEFEELLGKMLNGEVKVGQTATDILPINHLSRQLALLAYSWEQRLLQITSSNDRDSHTSNLGPRKDDQVCHSYSSNISDQRNQEPWKNMILGLSEGHSSVMESLPDTLDAAWTGQVQSAPKDEPIYEDEPSSIISYALLSYHSQITNDSEKVIIESSVSESQRRVGPTDECISSSFLDPLSYTTSLHTHIALSEARPQGKVKYTVTCYYAKQFEALRKACCLSELDFIRSLSRCTKCEPQGSNNRIFHAKTLDDHFIIKEVTKKELESFIVFAPSYLKYISESIANRSATCLAKIFGIYQITTKNLEVGKESKMEVLVMENLMLGHNITRMYDLKGCSESRYNPDPSGNNKVLLDQNLIEAMPTSPIYIGCAAKRLMERAIWNDTSFLGAVNAMEYSLLVGLDDEKYELVIGVIDYMRQYTWDKQLETWVKRGFRHVLGGTKNESPTVIPPNEYKKRFRKALSDYFIMVPDEEFHL